MGPIDPVLFGRQRVAITQRGVVLERELEQVGVLYLQSDRAEVARPNHDLDHVGEHQCEHGDGEQRRQPHEHAGVAGDAMNVTGRHNDCGGHDRMDREGDEIDQDRAGQNPHASGPHQVGRRILRRGDAA